MVVRLRGAHMEKNAVSPAILDCSMHCSPRGTELGGYHVHWCPTERCVQYREYDLYCQYESADRCGTVYVKGHVCPTATPTTSSTLLTVAVGSANEVYVAVSPPANLIAEAAGSSIVSALDVVVSEDT
jgi:hypothetical protein